MCDTFSPGTMRSSSGIVVAPERSIISGVMTNTAAADFPRVLSSRETVVTRTFISSSRLAPVSASAACALPAMQAKITAIPREKHRGVRLRLRLESPPIRELARRVMFGGGIRFLPVNLFRKQTYAFFDARSGR